MDLSQIDYSQIIIETINKLFNELFLSIDNTLYSLLDQIVFIDESIIKDSFFEKAFGSAYQVGLISIADSLLVGFTIYYFCHLFSSSYSGENHQRPSIFILRILVLGICISSSHFICQQIILVSSLISDSIKEVGNIVFGIDISFNSLINQMNSYISSGVFNLFSFNGIMKSFISFSLISLLFNYSLRYTLIKVFILISPFAFLSLSLNQTSWLFKIWLRNFLSLLLLQSLICLIFLIIFSFDGTFSSTFSQLMYLGSIYALSKSNQYIRELVGSISTDFNISYNSFKSIFY